MYEGITEILVLRDDIIFKASQKCSISASHNTEKDFHLQLSLHFCTMCIILSFIRCYGTLLSFRKYKNKPRTLPEFESTCQMRTKTGRGTIPMRREKISVLHGCE